MTDPAERLPTTEAGRALLSGPAMKRAFLSDILAIEAQARAAGAAAERERLMHYIQHEPDCAERTQEGDCVCGLAAILDAPAEEE